MSTQPTNPESVKDGLTQEQADLSFARDIRTRLIQSLITDEQGAELYRKLDTESIRIISSLLADSDRSALTSQRNKIQAEATKTGNENAAIIAEMLAKLSGNNMHQSAEDKNQKVPEFEPGTAPEKMVEGITDQHPGNETFSAFKERMDKKYMDEE